MDSRSPSDPERTGLDCVEGFTQIVSQHDYMPRHDFGTGAFSSVLATHPWQRTGIVRGPWIDLSTETTGEANNYDHRPPEGQDAPIGQTIGQE
jgi:hypothetical protein